VHKILVSTILFFSLLQASAQDFPEEGSSPLALSTRCYEMIQEDVPDGHDLGESSSTQTWCYSQIATSEGQVDQLIFSPIGHEVKPELSLLVDQEGVITHGSLLNDEVSIHRVYADEFNPFDVPLEEPRDQATGLTPAISYSQAEQVYQLFKKYSYQTQTSFSLQSVNTMRVAQSINSPWRGFWWPYKSGRLHNGASSPLAKYDRFVKARTGSNPGAQSWERSNHNYSGVWWEGHCNGWAAAAILRKEPRFSRRDSRSGITFSVADQKGLLSEADYCSAVAFFGKRNRGRASDNPRDISAAQFHKTVTYYLGTLRKPVVMDYHPTTAVDNHPVSGYTMDIERIGPRKLSVTAKLTFHRYDKKATHPPGVAPPYTRTYKYSLTEDESGKITGGAWRSANPDFIWVPLAVKDCGRNNPGIQFGQVHDILNLPSASNANSLE
jgi:hypothetical protein